MAAPTENIPEPFDLRSAAIKKWVEELPLGSTGETSKRIYHTVKQVNLQNSSVSQHLEFLETVAPTITLLYPRLSKYFTNVSLPLNTKTRNVIHVTSSLLAEVLRGYHSILKTLVSKKPFGWKKPFSLALHHSFIYSSQILCIKRLSYQSNTKGMWHDIFWCYQQAENLKLLNKSYLNNSTHPEKTSVQFEFKKLLLLSLLSTNELGHKSMQEVQLLMPLWVKHTDIFLKEPEEKKTCFTLNLLSDIPPYLIGTCKDNTHKSVDRHYLSTNKLKKLLANYLAKIDEDGSIKIGKNILSKTTIQSLLTTWSRNHLRTEVRKEGTGFVDIITGLNAIHFVLNQQDQPAYDEVSVDLPDNVINFESTLSMEPLKHTSKNDTLNLDHFLSVAKQEEDVWGKVYENTLNAKITEANWTESGSYKAFSFTKSILLDYSKDGYRLSVNAKKVDSLKHSELVAVREHALAPWALAHVKWLHFSEMGDVQFGLQILTHHVLPINIRYSANKSMSKPLPCLLGLDRQKLMMFIPRLPTNLNDKTISLEHQKQHSQIRLKNKILSTSAFDIYEIQESELAEYTSKKKSKMTINSKPELIESIWKNF